MTPKFTREDVYRTNDKIVSLGNMFEAQYIVSSMNKIGTYEGKNYWNCFDIYEHNGIRFLYGEGTSPTENYSHVLMKECGRTIKETCPSWLEEDKKKKLELIDKFCDSIEQNISIIKSFKAFKHSLYEQKKKFPDKPLIEIASDLTKYYMYDDSVKEKISESLIKVMIKVIKNTPEKMNDEIAKKALSVIYEEEASKEIAEKKAIETKTNIHRLLNVKDAKDLPAELKTMANLHSSRLLFNDIVQTGKGKTFIKEVVNFYQKNGAFIKQDKNKVNWIVSFKELSPKQRKNPEPDLGR